MGFLEPFNIVFFFREFTSEEKNVIHYQNLDEIAENMEDLNDELNISHINIATDVE